MWTVDKVWKKMTLSDFGYRTVTIYLEDGSRVMFRYATMKRYDDVDPPMILVATEHHGYYKILLDEIERYWWSEDETGKILEHWVNPDYAND